MATGLLVGLSVAVPSTAQAQRLEAGGFITSAFLEQIGSTDHGIGTLAPGLGGRPVWHVVRFVDLDGELAIHPNVGVSGYKVRDFLAPSRASVTDRGLERHLGRRTCTGLRLSSLRVNGATDLDRGIDEGLFPTRILTPRLAGFSPFPRLDSA